MLCISTILLQGPVIAMVREGVGEKRLYFFYVLLFSVSSLPLSFFSLASHDFTQVDGHWFCFHPPSLSVSHRNNTIFEIIKFKSLYLSIRNFICVKVLHMNTGEKIHMNKPHSNLKTCTGQSQVLCYHLLLPHRVILTQR